MSVDLAALAELAAASRVILADREWAEVTDYETFRMFVVNASPDVVAALVRCVQAADQMLGDGLSGAYEDAREVLDAVLGGVR